MADTSDIARFARLREQSDIHGIIEKPPKLPEVVLKRFPELRKWEEDWHKYMVEKVGLAVRGGTP